MSKLLRYFSPGNIYFITSVTAKRISLPPEQIECLLNILNKYRIKLNFELIAFAILPDHLHAIIDPKENDLSNIMQKIKLSFSKQIRNSRRSFDGIIWQRRFWDHIIRDQNDMNRHIDYIHYNPVKHKHVSRPAEWKYSSFNEYLMKEYYTADWGVVEPIIEGDFGES